MNEPPHVALIVETSLISGREILRGISRYAREQGSWSIYHEPRSLEASVPRWLKKWHGHGIIVRLQNAQIAKEIVETGLPAVDVLGVVPDAKVPLVHVDDWAIGRLAATHLMDRGVRNFGFCGLRGLNWSENRLEAFSAAVAEAGCCCDTYLLPKTSRSDSSWEAQQERLASWIRRLPKPLGIMSCYDPVGQKVLEACRRAEASVPEQVAVIGVDNDETVCEVCDPPLSSVAAAHFRVGYEAAKLLQQIIAGRNGSSTRNLSRVNPTGVIERLSTDTLAIDDMDVSNALRFIRQRAHTGIRVNDVVDHVSVSRSCLKERFRRLLGRSIHDEIVNAQVKRARELLADTELPLCSITPRAGFRHQEYMGAVFKAKTGKTPGQFRKDARA